MDFVAPIVLATTIFVGGITFFAEPYEIGVEQPDSKAAGLDAQ